MDLEIPSLIVGFLFILFSAIIGIVNLGACIQSLVEHNEKALSTFLISFAVFLLGLLLFFNGFTIIEYKEAERECQNVTSGAVHQLDVQEQ